MQTIKRFVTIIALIYLLLALLLLFIPFERLSQVGIFGVYSLAMEVNVLLAFTWAGLFVVGLLLVFENLDSGLLRRTIDQQEKKINELKAQLFDAKKPLGGSVAGSSSGSRAGGGYSVSPPPASPVGPAPSSLPPADSAPTNY